MIYLFSSLDKFTDEMLENSLAIVPEGRRKHALKFGAKEDQKRAVIGWLLLAYGLRKEYGIARPPEFSYGASGKPFLPGENMPFFSISHSGNYIGCALHSEEIGLDIQKTVTPRPSLIRKVCTQKEAARVDRASQDSSRQEFCRIWTQKESVVKLTGEGICKDFRNILLLHPEIHTATLPLAGGAYFLSCSTLGVPSYSSGSISP